MNKAILLNCRRYDARGYKMSRGLQMRGCRCREEWSGYGWVFFFFFFSPHQRNWKMKLPSDKRVWEEHEATFSINLHFPLFKVPVVSGKNVSHSTIFPTSWINLVLSWLQQMMVALLHLCRFVSTSARGLIGPCVGTQEASRRPRDSAFIENSTLVFASS